VRFVHVIQTKFDSVHDSDEPNEEISLTHSSSCLCLIMLLSLLLLNCVVVTVEVKFDITTFLFYFMYSNGFQIIESERDKMRTERH